ncbi:RsmD family RNA methyltransferase [Capnocytophaga sp.]|uniref:THUMP-like domain-containing protein n=1 Tax=Capnocytophaga sp. TaxID=44737 RepID=UPI0026DBBB31|nr:RsmD family RNA methyltransferase [Capnocytophaga sp.]MDO5105576.1 RsmD family RNA methyltransferase [Capnocytophaga sp.]
MILDKAIQDFILANLNIKVTDLVLKKPIFDSVSNKDLAEQIVGRKVAQKKFPFLTAANIIFPPQLNLEQASSQQTAEFKAAGLSGNTFLDLTCGLGVDAFFLSQNFKEVHLVEQNPTLCNLVAHNWGVLKRTAHIHQTTIEAFLEANQQKFDVVFIDPARRDSNNQKKFLLDDLSPNLLLIQEKLWQITDKVLLKLSPLIDIKYLLSALANIEHIAVIAVKNDVKELFVVQNSQNATGNITCQCVNLDTDDTEFSFPIEAIDTSKAAFSAPKTFLYIPNNALLKSGAFNLIAAAFRLEKLDINTHLYTSDELKANFPGRIVRVNSISAKNIEKGGKYNLITKNYPLSVDEVKKKYKLKEGGSDYLIFTQSIGGKEILIGEVFKA